MSRIFDALRKSEQEDKGPTAIEQSRKAPRVSQTAALRHEAREPFENVERIILTITSQKHILTCGDDHAVGAEKFRVLRQRLQKIRADRPLTKLLVSSAVPQEGKTLVAVNLAFSLARVSRRVLLVDADLRHPGVHEMLGLGAVHGLTEYLRGEIDDHKAMKRLDPWNLYYMPAGRSSGTPGELLQSPRMTQLMNRLGRAFEWIVVDTAPITLFADSPHLASMVDGSLLVVRLGVTPADVMQEAVAALEGNYIAGVVINGDTENRSHQYDYYGYTTSHRQDHPESDEKVTIENDSAHG